MITIEKRFTFDAAHRLEGLPPDHKCSRMHGHTYAVEIRLHGLPNAQGMLVDYQAISDAWKPIAEQLDHRYLNEIAGLSTPTTEVLVIWIFDRLGGTPIAHLISSVRVEESSSTYAQLNARAHKLYRRASEIVALVGA